MKLNLTKEEWETLNDIAIELYCCYKYDTIPDCDELRQKIREVIGE